MKSARSLIPDRVLDVMSKIKESGGEAFLVGGCVRDTILMTAPRDYDIATSLKPNEIMKLFPDGEEIGTKFGIIKLKDIDISTYRIDGKYSDGKHPDEVMFVNDIAQDLSRRDFTINAVAFDGERYMDPYNGMDAIRRGVIQTVNSSRARFEEDPARMLRAFRFSALLKYTIANSTYKQVRTCKHLISKVAPERVRDELIRMMSGESILGALFSMSASGLLFEIFPDLMQCKSYAQNKNHKYDVLEHSFRAVEAVPCYLPMLRIAALFHDIGKPATCNNYGTPDASFYNHEFVSADMARTIFEAFKFSKKDIEYMTTMIQCHMFRYLGEMTDTALRRLLRKVGRDRVDDLMIIKYADRVANGTKPYGDFNDHTEMKKRIDKIYKDEDALKISDLAVRGDDLRKIGIEDGPFMGKMLEHCLGAVMLDPKKNKKSVLLKIAKEALNLYNNDKAGELQERVV